MAITAREYINGSACHSAQRPICDFGWYVKQVAYSDGDPHPYAGQSTRSRWASMTGLWSVVGGCEADWRSAGCTNTAADCGRVESCASTGTGATATIAATIRVARTGIGLLLISVTDSQRNMANHSIQQAAM